LDLGQGEGKFFSKKQTGEQADPPAVGGGIPHRRHIGHEEKWDGEKAQEDVFQASEGREFPIPDGKHSRIIAQHDAVNISGDREMICVGTEDLRPARSNIPQKFLSVSGGTGRKRPTDAPKRVGIAPGDHSERIEPRPASAAVFEQGQNERVMLPREGAVADFKHVKPLRHELNEFAQAGAVRKVVEEMVQNEEQVTLPQVKDEFRRVCPELLDFAVLGFVQAIDADVDGVAEFRKEGADFLAYDKVVEFAQAVEKVQAAVKGIVVGDGD